MTHLLSCTRWFCLVLFSSLASAQEPASSSGKVIQANGINIYYEEQGKGEPLILLHGFGRTASDWKPFIPELSKEYRVIAWDMRGHGRSAQPDTSETFLHAVAARDLIAIIESLKLPNVNLIGHSSGGIIALYAAILRPDLIKAIVPVSAQLHFSDSVRSFIKRNAVPEAYYEFMDLEKLHGVQKGRMIAKQFYHFRQLVGDPAITHDQLKSIKAKTLIVHGDNDFVPVSQAWEMFEHIPGAHLSIIANGWHEPHFGDANQKDFIRRVSEFLRGDWDKTEMPK
jgi:pimeloyl-ACP methyl ester carboxylesterase